MIRKAQEKDIPALHKLLQQVLTVHANARPDVFKSGTTKYTNEQLARILRDENTPVFVAVDENDRVHGYVFCVYKQVEAHNILCDRKYLYIDDLCVDENCRGQKIGKALFEYATLIAKEKGCSSIRLNVWSLNENAMGFYEKLRLSPLSVTMEKRI